MPTFPLSTKLLIFDLDGTLIDSRDDIVAAFEWTLAEWNLPPVAPQLIAEHVGKGVQYLLLKTLQEAKVSSPEQAMQDFRAHYLAHCADKTRFYAGIEELLIFFASNPKVVLSNKSNLFIGPLLERLGAAHHFRGCYGLESFPTHKPDPGPIHALLSQFHVEPENAVIVGDTDNDILAGQRAGIKTCAALFGFGDPEELLALSPTRSVRQPGDLIRVLSEI